jgi:anti-anti-sigma factor
VDFFGVVGLSSLMLGQLIKLHKKMAANLGQLVLCGLSPELRRVLDETRLSQLFKIRESEAAALAALV